MLITYFLVGLVSGFFGRGGYDSLTEARACSDVYSQLNSEYGAAGLQYMGPRLFPGVELHGWLDTQSGEITVHAFIQNQEMALEAQNQGFAGEGICLTPAGQEIYMSKKVQAPPPVGDEAAAGSEK